MTEQQFFEKMAVVWLEIDKLRQVILDLKSQLKGLDDLGMADATIHVRADNGGMELIHPTGSEYERSNGRRREYIGKKEHLQQAARERVSRWKEHINLKAQLNQKEGRLAEIERKIETLEMAALGKQTRMFS